MNLSSSRGGKGWALTAPATRKDEQKKYKRSEERSLRVPRKTIGKEQPGQLWQAPDLSQKVTGDNPGGGVTGKPVGW